MTRYIVRCLIQATKIDLAVPGRTPERAVWNAQKNKTGQRASAFVVYDRKTGNLVHTAVNK